MIITGDGSPSIRIPDLGVTYHSIHGALQESQHVYIRSGFDFAMESHPTENPVDILEIGFGTGLNALLTAIASKNAARNIRYTTIDLNPLEIEMALTLNYPSQTGDPADKILFECIHSCEWERAIPVSETFTILKKKISLTDFYPDSKFHLIYFDAFAPGTQPELWTADIFTRMYQSLHRRGILVTYCAKGDVRRAMQSAGLIVEKLQGPIGKREMLRGLRM